MTKTTRYFHFFLNNFSAKVGAWFFVTLAWALIDIDLNQTEAAIAKLIEITFFSALTVLLINELMFYFLVRWGSQSCVINWLAKSDGASIVFPSCERRSLVQATVQAIDYKATFSQDDKVLINKLEDSFKVIASARGTIPVEVLNNMKTLYSDAKTSPRADKMLEYIVNVHRASESISQDHLDEFIKFGVQNVPSPLINYFTKELNDVRKRIKDMNSDLGITQGYHKWGQFKVAASVALWQSKTESSKTDFTFRATSLDAPSNFYSNYGAGYFKVQKRLGDFGIKENVRSFWKSELSYTESNDVKSHRSTIPSIARIVIIGIDSIFDEFCNCDKNEVFYKFVLWHIQNNYGLKFVVSEQKWPDKQLKDFQRQLAQYDPSETEDETIDDYVVYNQSVVFGRTNVVSDQSGSLQSVERINIRLLDKPDFAAKYHEYFDKELWLYEEAKTPKQLVDYLRTKIEDCPEKILLENKSKNKIEVIKANIDKFVSRYNNALVG